MLFHLCILKISDLRLKKFSLKLLYFKFKDKDFEVKQLDFFSKDKSCCSLYVTYKIQQFSFERLLYWGRTHLPQDCNKTYTFEIDVIWHDSIRAWAVARTNIWSKNCRWKIHRKQYEYVSQGVRGITKPLRQRFHFLHFFE